MCNIRQTNLSHSEIFFLIEKREENNWQQRHDIWNYIFLCKQRMKESSDDVLLKLNIKRCGANLILKLEMFATNSTDSFDANSFRNVRRKHRKTTETTWIECLMWLHWKCWWTMHISIWHSALGRTMYESIKSLRNLKWTVLLKYERSDFVCRRMCQMAKCYKCQKQSRSSELQISHERKPITATRSPLYCANLEMKLKWYACADANYYMLLPSRCYFCTHTKKSIKMGTYVMHPKKANRTLNAAKIPLRMYHQKIAHCCCFDLFILKCK